MAHPDFVKELNHDALALYFQYGYIPNPHCIFHHTQKLQPGHILTLNLQHQTTTLRAYWNVYDYYNKPSLSISFEEAKSQTESIIKSACDYRMVSDVPVGVFLSGGYDSTLVTALLQKDSTEKIKTFTIGFHEKKYNEALYAKEVAQHLGTDHTEYYCTEKEALEIVPELPYYYDEPFADSSALPTTLVSRLARKKVTVALSADAGDEIFAGYNRYDYIMKFGNKIKKIPTPIRKLTATLMDALDADHIPILRNKYLFHSRYEKVKQFLLQADDYHINQVLCRQFVPPELSTLLKHSFNPIKTSFDDMQLQKEHYHTLQHVMAIDYQTYLVDDILQKVDRATMSISLEGREPLLDHRIIEWAAQLPIEFKYHVGIKKHILREIVHQYVPKDMMDRPKMGFAIPVEHWLSNELKPMVDHYFSTSFLQKQNLFHIHEVQKLIQAFQNGKKERAEKIWYLLMFQLWYEKWM
jgi:Asparagine synthase (glutamine-hydrolyzing)